MDIATDIKILQNRKHQFFATEVNNNLRENNQKSKKDFKVYVKLLEFQSNFDFKLIFIIEYMYNQFKNGESNI